MSVLRFCLIWVGLVLVWQAVVWLTSVPSFILPGPGETVQALCRKWSLLLHHAGITLLEISSGLFLGAVFGTCSALIMIASVALKRWLLPVLVMSQAVPVFALAPLLVLWLGYGLASKIAMAVLIIFFPVTAAFYDGLRSTDPEWLELARVMDASPRAILYHIRIPAALPSFASGLRVAAAVAPIGAVVGEWVGSSSGLGFYMLHANARMQTDLMFAALVLLVVMALGLYFFIDWSMRRAVYWKQSEIQEMEQ